MTGNIITMKLKGCMLALALTSGACSAATAEKGFFDNTVDWLQHE